MDLLQRIQQAKQKLAKVDTIVRDTDGGQFVETRNADGGFEKVDAEENINQSQRVFIEDRDVNEPVSKRRMKRVARAQRFGFVIDLKPDLQIANVADGLFVGSQDVAQDFPILKSSQITHILNCATGIKNIFPTNFTYMNVELLDEPSAKIKSHFRATNDFISTAVRNGGRVFVHCNAGISRSCTIVIAYVMWSEHKSYFDAFKQVKDIRTVCRPNDGFMRQLREYEDELKSNACQAL